METSPRERVRGYKLEDIEQHIKVLGYIERVCLSSKTQAVFANTCLQSQEQTEAGKL